MSTSIKFRCGAGHEYESDGDPIRFAYKANNQLISSGPICPTCLLEWISRSFPAVEVSRIETVEAEVVDEKTSTKN